MSKKLDLLRKDKEFLALLGKIPDKELAEKYNVSIFFVRDIRREKGLAAKRIHNYPDGIELYAGKMTDGEAAERLNSTIAVIFRYRLEYNINPFKKEGVFSNTEQIIKDYEDLGTLQKVADKHGCTREWIRQVLKRAGYDKRYYNFTAKDVVGRKNEII